MGVLAWGDIRLGRVRKEDETREKGRIKCETTSKSEMSRMDRRRKREGRGEGERERERFQTTSQKESRCKLGLSGSRLQLEDKSFPRDSCAFGSGTREPHRSVWMVEDDEKDG